MRSLLHALKDIMEDVWIRLVLKATTLIPGRPGNILTEPIRCAFLRRLGISIGRGSQISPGFRIFRMGSFEAGSNCRFGYDFHIWNFAEFRVGDRLLASHGIKVICGTHKVSVGRENVAGPVTIGDDVWLSADITIVGPCDIGHGVIVGANSFVTGSLQSGWVYAGNPARAVRAVTDTSKKD